MKRMMNLSAKAMFFFFFYALLGLNAGLASAQSCIPPSSGMIGWWPGDGSTTDLISGNTATLIGNATYANGEVSQGFSLPGSVAVESRAQVSDSINLQIIGPFTLDAWVSFNGVAPASGATTNSPIVGKWGDTSRGTGGYGLFVFSDGTPVFAVSSTGTNAISVSSPIKLTAAFTHVAGVYDGTNLNLYINGVLAAKTAFNGVVHGSNGVPLLIGGYSSAFTNANDSMIGVIDEIGIYNRPLDAAEIQAKFNAESAGVCENKCVPPSSGMIGWWPGDGSTTDLISGNTATLIGNATYANGEVSQGFSLPGSAAVESRAQVSDSINLQIIGPFTLDAWVSFNGVAPASGATTNSPIVGKWGDTSRGTGGYGLFVFSDGTPVFAVSSTGTNAISVSSPIRLTAAFTHVAGVYDGTNLNLYINGVLAAKTVFNGVVHGSNGVPLLIGGYSSAFTNANDSMIGVIDEIGIYNRPLDAAEIQAKYSSGSAGVCK